MRTRPCADPVGALGLAVAMEASVAEVQSESLGLFGKGIAELGTCLGRGEVGAGETGDVVPGFLTAETERVVAPLAPWQSGWQQLGDEGDGGNGKWGRTRRVLPIYTRCPLRGENVHPGNTQTEEEGRRNRNFPRVACSPKM